MDPDTFIIVPSILFLCIAGVIITGMGLRHARYKMEWQERMRSTNPAVRPKNIKLPFFQMEFDQPQPTATQRDDQTLSSSELKDMIRETMAEVIAPIEARLSKLEQATQPVPQSAIGIPEAEAELDKSVGRTKVSA